MSHIAILGGGLAGLLSAAHLAEAGHTIDLYERASHLGGRARSQTHAQATFDLGPHAMYVNGPLHRALTHFGIPIRGRAPAGTGWWLRDSALHRLPATPVDLLRTTGLSALDRIALARVLVTPPSPVTGTVADWLTRHVRRPAVRDILEAFFRLVTYASDLSQVDVQLALTTLQAAQSAGVWYIDGGWQQLIDSLTAYLATRSVTFHTGHRVDDIHALNADAVVLAISPAAVRRIHPEWAPDVTPVCASCLDVVLTQLPCPEHRFVLGDRLYQSVHSLTARLAPNGTHVVHAMAYGHAERPVLEGLLDTTQPGWRDHLAHVRYLPRVTVSQAHPNPDRRPHRVSERVWVVGDWVASGYVLADAVADSAKRVAQDIGTAAQIVAA